MKWHKHGDTSNKDYYSGGFIHLCMNTRYTMCATTYVSILRRKNSFLNAFHVKGFITDRQ